MRVCFSTVAVNYCGGDHAGVVGIYALYDNRFSKKADITVAVAGIGSRLELNDIAGICSVDGVLDGGVIARAVCIYNNETGSAGNWHKQGDDEKKVPFFHISALLKKAKISILIYYNNLLLQIKKNLFQ
jgi:hypothetical protein